MSSNNCDICFVAIGDSDCLPIFSHVDQRLFNTCQKCNVVIWRQNVECYIKGWNYNGKAKESIQH